MKHLPCILATFLLILSGTTHAQQPKKLIEWGWDEPDTKFIRQNIENMEQLPFDGLIFHAASSTGGNFVWEMWGKKRFELAEFQNSVRLGLQRTDEYVWIYTERLRWWTNEKLPPAYVEALKAAKK